MKRRFGFVSNSSSCSFIVIHEGTPIEQKYFDDLRENREVFDSEGRIYIPNGEGVFEFGWQEETYVGFLDRLNFAFCQIGYLIEEDFESRQLDFPPSKGEAREWFMMLEEALASRGLTPHYVITKEDAEKERVRIYLNSFDFYIDHQSSVLERKNIEMFDSLEDLTSFLFDEGSYIKCDNDNH